MSFKDIYEEIKNNFLKIIIDKPELKNKLFDPDSDEILSSIHVKPLPSTSGARPESITEVYIKKLLYKIGIEEELIVPQVRLKSVHFGDRVFNRYPDFGILNTGKGKSLLIEVESLNKKLDKEGDGEGIEQAEEWFQICLGLYQKYNAIITNFNEWYILKYNPDLDAMEPIKKSPGEILEIIRDVAIGKERSYLEEEKGDAVSKSFYSKFSQKLRKLIDPKDNSILIHGLIKPSNISDEEFEQMKISYYRKIFSRMMFIKILLDWKLLEFNPIQEIFDKEPSRNYFNNLKDLFFKVFNNDGERIDILEKFKELPYLNGGLFRSSETEEKYPNISLNSEAILEIWELLKEYNFTSSDEENNNEENNTINPNILGYIFEKSIGDYRKATGAYYTRSKITNYISRNTLNRFFLDNINKKFQTVLPWPLDTFQQLKMYPIELRTKIYKYFIKLLEKLKICDPAVGSGAFLVSIGELIVRIYNFLINIIGLESIPYKSTEEIEGDKRRFKDLYELKTFIVQNNLYGVDINPSAVEICELRLWLWIVQPPPNLDTIDIKLEPLPNIEYNIRVGNSLFGYTSGIREIESFDKTAGEKVKFAMISEWAGKKEESISQMLIERNYKIKKYYEEGDADKRNNLRTEIQNLTDQFNTNFDKLLLQEYKEKKIVSKELNFKHKEIDKLTLENVESILIRFKNNIDILDSEKKIIKTDDRGNEIKGLTFRKNSISISNRVFQPENNDKFKAQDPKSIYKKIVRLINLEDIKVLVIRFFVDDSDLLNLRRFHWSMEFSDFFNSNGFDIIIANPPYGNILTSLGKEILKSSDKITEDIYINFLYKLSRHEIPFQYAGILTPKSYLLRQKYLDIRNTLLEKVGIYEITDIGSKQFQGATNEVQILFFHNNRDYTNKIKIKDIFENKVIIEYDQIENTEESVRIDQLRVCFNHNCDYYDGIASYYYYTFNEKCPICTEDTLPLNRIRIKPSIEIFSLIKKIEEKGNLNYLNTKDFPKMVRGEEDIGLIEVKKKLGDNLDGNCIFIDAKEDMRYYYFKKNKSFNIEEISSIILKGDNYEYYRNPKLLIKHNSIIPETLYTEDNVCFTSSIYSLLHKDENELKYLSAILNSALIQFYCIYAINNQRDTTINLNQYMIRHLPILKPNEDVSNKIILNVDEINQYLKNNDNKINDEIYPLFKEIDTQIFDLFNITDEERDLIISEVISQIEFFKEIYQV